MLQMEKLSINETSTSEQFHDCSSQPVSPAPAKIEEQQTVNKEQPPAVSGDSALSAGMLLSLHNISQRVQ